MTNLRASLACLALSALYVTACGDDGETSTGSGGGSSSSATNASSASTGPSGSTSSSSASSTQSSGGAGGDGTGGSGGGGDGGSGGSGTGGSEPGACVVENVANVDACDAGCDAAFTNEDDTVSMCTITCGSNEDCDTENTGLICDGAFGACLFSCADGDVCPVGFVCDDAETLLCIPDEISG
jgi:hypothetical protein